jgi:hypothetical protein
LGKMISAVKDNFETIFSIELSHELFQQCSIIFKEHSHIHILHGDSAHLFPAILQKLKEPALFWLDAHYSGDITAKSDIETPIMLEIAAILKHHIEDHVILVDDARLFNGLNDYPSLKELTTFITRQRADMKIEIDNDIIRIHK